MAGEGYSEAVEAQVGTAQSADRHRPFWMKTLVGGVESGLEGLKGMRPRRRRIG